MPQMLTYLAANDKRILYNLGVDDDFVKRETARAAAATKWHAMTESDKRNSDEAAWTGWLEKYIARLGREEAAGAKEEQRQALMSRSNPRIVLRNWVRGEACDVLALSSETGEVARAGTHIASQGVLADGAPLIQSVNLTLALIDCRSLRKPSRQRRRVTLAPRASFSSCFATRFRSLPPKTLRFRWPVQAARRPRQ